MSVSRPAMVAIIALLAMLGPFASNIVIPSLPTIAESMNSSASQVQLILSVYMAGFAIGQLFVGPLSDRFGRKPVLALSLTICTLASIGGALSQDLTALNVSRLMQALGLSATLSIGRAIVRDIFPTERVAQTFAYVGAALALGPILGPVIGGFIEIAAGWRAVFWCVTGAGGLSLLAITLLLQETNRHLDHGAIRLGSLLGSYRSLLMSRRYVGYVMCNAIGYGGIFAFASCSSQILIGSLGVAPDLFGVLFALTIGCYGVGSLSASRLTARCGIDRMIIYGGLTMTVSGLLLVGFTTAGILRIWSVVGPFALFAFGTGFVFPNGQAGAISPYPESAGVASSMLSFIQMAFAACIGAFAARILDDTAQPLAWIVLALGLSLLLGFYVLVSRPWGRTENLA